MSKPGTKINYAPTYLEAIAQCRKLVKAIDAFRHSDAAQTHLTGDELNELTTTLFTIPQRTLQWYDSGEEPPEILGWEENHKLRQRVEELEAEKRAVAEQLEPPFDDSPLSERVAQLLRSYTDLLKRHDALRAEIDGQHDPSVDHPAHYNQGAIECIDALEVVLGPEGAAAFCRGNAIKYLWRAGAKGDLVEDLSKARWYLEREISIRKKGAANGARR